MQSSQSQMRFQFNTINVSFIFPIALSRNHKNLVYIRSAFRRKMKMSIKIQLMTELRYYLSCINQLSEYLYIIYMPYDQYTMKIT